MAAFACESERYSVKGLLRRCEKSCNGSSFMKTGSSYSFP